MDGLKRASEEYSFITRTATFLGGWKEVFAIFSGAALKNIDEDNSKGIPRLCHKARAAPLFIQSVRLSRRRRLEAMLSAAKQCRKTLSRRLWSAIASLSRLLDAPSPPTQAKTSTNFSFRSRAAEEVFKRALATREKKLRALSSADRFSPLLYEPSEMMLIYIRLKFASLRFIHCVEFQATLPFVKAKTK